MLHTTQLSHLYAENISISSWTCRSFAATILTNFNEHFDIVSVSKYELHFVLCIEHIYTFWWAAYLLHTIQLPYLEKVMDVSLKNYH